ncbi:TonB-dependent receptor [uncultured Alistipes sp.]|uniref:SusC/RagA family TonB-linked outer membrane protein n=1 Tax=uncultured Alistipes sp. TaxID=538949 RepID=UPI0025A5671C|nr:TonB-dependent receptor [uncultured Alistipes sp.]
MTEKFYSFTKTAALRLALVLAFVSLAAGSASAQSRTVTGTVKDSMGPVLAASVVVEGTTLGVSTDLNGKFRIEVPASAKQLRVSFIGYDDSYVTLQPSQTDYEVTLSESSNQLDDVVVVGYATVKRRDVVGSVSSINSEALTQMPVASVSEAMSGRMAGVQVTATEGDPDADVRIRVRGTGSITQDSSPLYIVDGFPVESISDIPASDIQSIDVLKDAFSTAIYGSRGANGVIIVTTKSGESGRITVNYNIYGGVKNMANKDALVPQNTYDFVRTQYEYSVLKGNTKSYYTPNYGTWEDMDLYRNMPANDWVEQVFGRTGTVFDHNLSVSGNGDKYKWTASYSHHDEKTIMIGSDYKRNNLSFKGQFKPVKRVSIDVNVRYSDVHVTGSGANGLNDRGSQSGNSRLKNAIVYSPIPRYAAIIEEDNPDDYSNYVHPIQAVRENDSRYNRTTWNANAAFQWEIIDNLRLRIEAGLDDYKQVKDRFYGISSYASRYASAGYQNKPLAEWEGIYRDKIRNTNTLQYDFKKLLPKDHNLNLLVGMEYLRTSQNTMNTVVEGLPDFFDSNMAWKFMASGEHPLSVANKYANDDILFSFFGRANYDYKGKYMVSATMRADGSSKFAKGNQWGYFPSVAASWRLSGEEWLKNATWIDNLKIRYSFGTAGNNNIPSGQTQTLFSASQTSWISQGSVIWSNGTTMSNPDLKWETTYSHNIGIDFGFWNSRLTGSVELYQSNTKDLLIKFPVTGGYSEQYRNLGEVQNRGIEVTLGAALVRKEKWGINFDANISFNKNEVVDLGGLDQITASAGMFSTEIGYDYIVKKGRPLGDIYGYVNQGMYTVDDFDYDGKTWTLKEGIASSEDILGKDYDLRPGAPRLAKVSDDDPTKITTNDITRIGNTQPLFTGGFSLTAYAYGFDVAANFTYSYGNEIYNANKIEFSTTKTTQGQNVLNTMAPSNRWTNIDWATGELVNDPALLAQMNAGKTMWTPYSTKRVAQSWAIEDGSFLRLASLTIGYTVPEHLTRKIRLTRVRVYATGTNLFCLTPYTGYDPEVDTRRATPLTPGVDYSAFPKSRSWVFGLNLSF